MTHLTPAEAELLLEVYRHPGRGPLDHSEALSNDPGWTNKLLRKLEQNGLTERYTPTRRAARSRSRRHVRPLHKALLVRQGYVVAFGDGCRRRLPVDGRWTTKALAGASLLLGQPALVVYRTAPDGTGTAPYRYSTDAAGLDFEPGDPRFLDLDG